MAIPTLTSYTVPLGQSFSDGYSAARPTSYLVCRCARCKKVVWPDAVALATPPRNPEDASHGLPNESTSFALPLDVGGWVEALPTLAGRDRQSALLVRMNLWHALNHPRRQNATAAMPPMPEAVQAVFDANLEALLELLDTQVAHEALLRAEALRELGRFDEAVRAYTLVEGDLATIAAALRTLAQQQVAEVRAVEESGDVVAW